MAQKILVGKYLRPKNTIRKDQTSSCPAQLTPILLPSLLGFWMETCCLMDQSSNWWTFRQIKVEATAVRPSTTRLWDMRRLRLHPSLYWVIQMGCTCDYSIRFSCLRSNEGCAKPLWEKKKQCTSTCESAAIFACTKTTEAENKNVWRYFLERPAAELNMWLADTTNTHSAGQS